MRRIGLAIGCAALLTIAPGAWGQDTSPPKPAPQTRPLTPVAPKPPKPPKPQTATPATPPADPVEATDQREEERLNEKLKSICRGC
jgi:hypothetical protein